jgi:hypothetical protein
MDRDTEIIDGPGEKNVIPSAERGIFLELRVRFVSNCTTPQKADRYQNMGMRIDPKGVTPECFNRGSSSGLAWIPDRSIRE